MGFAGRLMMRLTLASAVMAEKAATCSTDSDCNNAGRCVSYRCSCDSTWRGPTCSELALLLAQSNGNGLHVPPNWGNTWGGSIANDTETKYHMFASLFKNTTLTNWKTKSVIVHATSTSIQGPYSIDGGIVLSPRFGTEFWDAHDCHNPTIHKLGNEWVLFYIGEGKTTASGRDRLQVIGAAYSLSLDGPWKRTDKALLAPTMNWECGGGAQCGVSNPAVLQMRDGTLLMFYRGNQDRGLGVAKAQKWRGPWVKQSNESLITGDVVIGLEDMYVFENPEGTKRPGCHMVLHQERAGTDNLGAHAWTADPQCISGWRMAAPWPSRAYGPEFYWDNGTMSNFTSRERPQVVFDAAGQPAFISNAIVTVSWQGPTYTLVAPIQTQAVFPTPPPATIIL